MTRKSRRESLKESLSEAVRPPAPSPKLNDILGRYATATPILQSPAPAPAAPDAEEAESPAAERPRPPADPGRVATPVARRDPGPVSTPPPPPERPRSPDDPGRHTKGHAIVTNHLLDDVLPTLEPPDQVVLLRLYKLTRGYRQSVCKVSVAKLTAKTRVKRTRLREALALLEDRGFIRRLADDVDSPGNYDRGMNIEMLLEGADPGRQASPVASRPRSSGDPNKEKDLKENSQKGVVRLTPEEIQSLTATVADLLREGQSIEEVGAKYAPSMHPVDWATVRSTALAQAGAKP